DARTRYNEMKGFGQERRTIGQMNHVPVSPLYQPGQLYVSKDNLTDSERWQTKE
ncbi:hypothetical protein BgiBS90_008299, partial [Biomphalaria glabrata]